MKKLKLLDTFAGIGGFSYAAEKLVGGFKTGSVSLPSVNFKQANKVREQIRNIKVDDFLLENFISICRKASFRAGYNADWIYRNVFAKKIYT